MLLRTREELYGCPPYRVIWNGTIDRQLAEQARRTATEGTESPQAVSTARGSTAAVRRVLRYATAPMTGREIARACGRTHDAVNSALYNMLRAGEVTSEVVENLTPRLAGHRLTVRVYRRTEVSAA